MNKGLELPYLTYSFVFSDQEQQQKQKLVSVTPCFGSCSWRLNLQSSQSTNVMFPSPPAPHVNVEPGGRCSLLTCVQGLGWSVLPHQRKSSGWAKTKPSVACFCDLDGTVPSAASCPARAASLCVLEMTWIFLWWLSLSWCLMESVSSKKGMWLEK